jgi:hypothetical protein
MLQEVVTKIRVNLETNLMNAGELYVVTELCELGSLAAYVKSHRATYINECLSADDQTTLTDNADEFLRNVAAQNNGYLSPNRITATGDAATQSTTMYQV